MCLFMWLDGDALILHIALARFTGNFEHSAFGSTSTIVGLKEQQRLGY